MPAGRRLIQTSIETGLLLSHERLVTSITASSLVESIYKGAIVSKSTRVSGKSPYNPGSTFSRCENMCEFNVFLNGKVQFKDVIYAKVDAGTVLVKNILGEAKEFKNCQIFEVDVPNTRLVLSEVKP